MQLGGAVRKQPSLERPFLRSFGGVGTWVKCRFYAPPKHGDVGVAVRSPPHVPNCTAQCDP